MNTEQIIDHLERQIEAINQTIAYLYKQGVDVRVRGDSNEMTVEYTNEYDTIH